MQQMVVVDQMGNRHGGAEAVRYLSRRIPRLWWLAPLMHVPGSLPVWRMLYGLVARYRYVLGGRRLCEDDSCQVHGGGRAAD